MVNVRTFSLLVLTLLTACGGGGGTTGSVSGLQGPQQVTIVKAAGASSAIIARATTVTDYQAATTHFWVHDESMKSLDTVNNILNYLHQTNYWDATVVNQGPYRAMVRDDSSDGGGRGNTGPTFEEWVIDSTRASNSAPQVVHFWVHTVDEDGGMGTGLPAIIYGRLTVVAAPSTSSPLGVFTLDFKQLLATDLSTSTNTGFQGYLESVARTDGQSEVLFFMSHGDPDGTVGVGESAMRQRVHVIGDPNTDAGRAYSEWKNVRNTGSPQTDAGEFNLQFDANFLALRDLVGLTTTVYDRHDFSTYVFDYGVYDAVTEAFAARNAGFPVETLSGGHGYAGYHGLWFPPDVTLTDGQALVRRSFTPGVAPTDYSAVVVPGRLEKRVRSSLTLGDLINENLGTFDPVHGQEIQVQYNNGNLIEVAIRSGNDFVPTTPLIVTGNYSTGQWLNFFSQARGSVEMIMPATLTDATPVYVWTNTTITADSTEVAGGPLTLYSYFHQLRPLLTDNQANYLNAEFPYFADASDTSTGNKTYVFDPVTMMLSESGNQVRLADGVSVTSGPGTFGFDCGPMFASPLALLSDVQTQTTTYQWFTGGNAWNQLRTLKDGNGAFVQFDQPLRFHYTHSEVGSEYDGHSYMLEWDGSHLNGVPSVQDTNSGRWYSVFNIPTGTVLSDGSSTYKLKQLQGEQIMMPVADPNATITSEGFDLSTTITHPTVTAYTDPAIGTMPVVSDPPKFVGGQVP